MSTRASRARAVRSGLAVLLRIAVLFALTVLFLLPYSQGSVCSPTHNSRPGTTRSQVVLSAALTAHAATSPGTSTAF